MSTTLATKRAVGYLRVSSVGQTGERHSSLETQEARFNDYCERLGLLAVTCFIDIVSGRRDDRKEYHRMLEYVEGVEEQRTRVSTAERLPGAIRSFLADFESLDVRHQKAQLQAILKSAYVYRDDRIELEFRG